MRKDQPQMGLTMYHLRCPHATILSQFFQILEREREVTKQTSDPGEGVHQLSGEGVHQLSFCLRFGFSTWSIHSNKSISSHTYKSW